MPLQMKLWLCGSSQRFCADYTPLQQRGSGPHWENPGPFNRLGARQSLSVREWLTILIEMSDSWTIARSHYIPLPLGYVYNITRETDAFQTL